MGLGIYYWLNRVVASFGVFALCASLAGKVLSVGASRNETSQLCETNQKFLQKCESQEKS